MPVLTFPKAFVYISRPYSAAHPAIDLGWGATVGGATAPLLSPGDGRVAAVADGCGWDRARGWGNYIRIDHGDGFETLLAHCLRGSFTVKKGDSVSRGPSGSTSWKTLFTNTAPIRRWAAIPLSTRSIRRSGAGGFYPEGPRLTPGSGEPIFFEAPCGSKRAIGDCSCCPAAIASRTSQGPPNNK